MFELPHSHTQLTPPPPSVVENSGWVTLTWFVYLFMYVIIRFISFKPWWVRPPPEQQSRGSSQRWFQPTGEGRGEKNTTQQELTHLGKSSNAKSIAHVIGKNEESGTIGNDASLVQSKGICHCTHTEFTDSEAEIAVLVLASEKITCALHQSRVPETSGASI